MSALVNILRLSSGSNVPRIRNLLHEVMLEEDAVYKLQMMLKRLDSKIIRVIALHLFQMNQREAARICWSFLVEQDVANIADHFALAAANMQFRGLAREEGQYKRSLDEFLALTQRAPDLAFVWLNIAVYWLNSLEPVSRWGEYAEHAVSRALECGADPAEAFYLRGVIREARGQRKLAVADYLNVLNMMPDHPAARIRLAWPDNNDCIGAYERKRISHYDVSELEAGIIEVNKEDGPVRAGNILNNSGAVIIRGILPVDLLQSLLEKYREVVAARREVEETGMWPLPKVDADLRGEIEQLMSSTGMTEWMNRIFNSRYPNWHVIHRHDWHVQWRGPGPHPHSPTPIHQDHPVFATGSEFITCWFSCTPCGDDVSPGLELYLEYFRHPIHFSDQFPEAPAAMDRGFVADYLRHRIRRPRFSPGDVLLFHPNIFHRTEHKQKWDGNRMSFDLRFQAGPSSPGFIDVVQNGMGYAS